MIVVDTSALIAILEYEPQRDTFLDVIGKASRRVISSVNFQEAGQVVYSRRSDAGLAQLNSLMAQINIEIVPFDAQLARVAIAAFQRFGKGHHSRARLNFCDCSAYALAATLGAPLLYKGEDFAATDLEPAA